MSERPYLFAVSGVKNSGKTTLITKLLPVLCERGIKTAVIKHDGHEFEADVPGTDTWAHQQAGAYGTAVFSDTKFMLVKQQHMTEQELWRFFPEADLILLEGFKYSTYPKIEVVRQGISERCVCAKEYVAAVVSDFIPKGCGEFPVISPENIQAVADIIITYMRREKSE